MNENAEYFYFKKLSIHDLSQLITLAGRCFLEPYFTENFFLPFLDSSDYISFGVFNQYNQLAAFICARILNFNDYSDEVALDLVRLKSFYESLKASFHLSAYVSLLGVDAHHRGKGLAKYLLTETKNYYKSIHNIKEIYLHVQSSNGSAIELYEKMGYSKLAVIDNYYRGSILDATKGSNDAYLCVNHILDNC